MGITDIVRDDIDTPSATRRVDRYAIAAFVIGSVAFVFGLWVFWKYTRPSWGSLLLAVATFSVGFYSLSRIKGQEGLIGRGVAIAGMVLSIAPFVLELVLLCFVFALAAHNGYSASHSFFNYYG